MSYRGVLEMREEVLGIVKEAERKCEHSDKRLFIFLVGSMPFGAILCNSCFCKIASKLKNREP